MRIATLPGISERTVGTHRTVTRVLFSGDAGAPVLFLHDSPASATFWEDTMLALPAGFRGIAPDLRGHGLADPDSKVSAVNNLGDMAADMAELLDEQNIARAHVVGHGWGGSIVWRLMMDYPERLLSATVINPYSPYGLGGIHGLDGKPIFPDFAGSGASVAWGPFEALDNPSAGRPEGADTIFNLFFNTPPRTPRADALLAAMRSVRISPFNYPGDRVPSILWPNQAAGIWGPLNSLSPMFAEAVSRLYAIQPKPSVLWIRGAADPLVSDESVLDPAVAGKRGELPDWPGEDVYPPQPMVGQTRAVLEKYAEAGGAWREVVMDGVGHTPFVEAPDAFNGYLHEFLTAESR